MDEGQNRTVEQVFRDHLRLRNQHNLEEDIVLNFARDCVLLTTYGIFHGHEGVRKSAGLLRELMPSDRYHYKTTMVAGEIAFLEWTAHTVDQRVTDGADSYLIRDGRILVQTIHYTVHSVLDAGAPEAADGGAAPP